MDKKLLYTLIFAFSWAFGIFVRKLALNAGAAPLPFLFQSSVITVTVLTGYVFSVKQKELFHLPPKTVKKFLLIGIFIGSAWIVDTLGLKFSTSINYSFIIKTGLAFSLLLAYLFLQEQISKQKILLACILLFGAYLITTGGQQLLAQVGDLLIIAAAFFYSSATVAQKTLAKTVSSTVIGWARTTSALIVLFLISPFFPVLDFRVVSPHYVFLAGIFLVLTTIYLNKALAVADLSYITLMTMSVPVINTILGVAILGEKINGLQIAGGVIILCSNLLLQFKKFNF